MKRTLLLSAAALALVLAPTSATAQCDAACLHIRKPDGSTAGYGCTTSSGSGRSCIATTSTCRSSVCMNAWLRGPDGTLSGLALRCTSEEGEVRAQTITEHPATERTVHSVGGALDPKTIPLPAA